MTVKAEDSEPRPRPIVAATPSANSGLRFMPRAASRKSNRSDSIIHGVDAEMTVQVQVCSAQGWQPRQKHIPDSMKSTNDEEIAGTVKQQSEIQPDCEYGRKHPVQRRRLIHRPVVGVEWSERICGRGDQDAGVCAKAANELGLQDASIHYFLIKAPNQISGQEGCGRQP